ncbi:hypothetical protein [Stenotrophomonas phage StenR_269]|nr:hypothetical protein [Stenotrophomonas phage StenR_269]
MSNSRIKDSTIGGGIKEEAIASTITMQYDPINPENTTVSFAYKRYLTDSAGNVLPYSDGAYDLITLKLSETLDWDLGDGLTVQDVVQGIRSATDIAHNKRAYPNVPVS